MIMYVLYIHIIVNIFNYIYILYMVQIPNSPCDIWPLPDMIQSYNHLYPSVRETRFIAIAAIYCTYNQ